MNKPVLYDGNTSISLTTSCYLIHFVLFYKFSLFQLNTEWVQIEAIDLTSDGSAWGFGITGGRSTGVVVKTIVPGSVTDKVRHFCQYYILKIYNF